MKKIKYYKILLLGTVFALTFGCSKNKSINEYSEQLQINFPKEMNLVYYYTHSDFQDYSIQSIYKLSFNEKNALLEEIWDKICDSSNEEDKLSQCWHRCDDYYSFKYYNEDDSVEIQIVFVAQNDIRTLSIYEYKL